MPANSASEDIWGMPGYTDLPLVSSDFRGDSRSSIVDGLMTTILQNEHMVRVVCWYDNEWGYASRVADLGSFISKFGTNGPHPEQGKVVEREPLHSLWL